MLHYVRVCCSGDQLPGQPTPPLADTDDPRCVTIAIVTIVTITTMCRCVPGCEMRGWQVARTSLGFLYPVYRSAVVKESL